MNIAEHEMQARALQDPELRARTFAEFDDYKPRMLPRFLGCVIILMGDLLYGRKPSYTKFRAIEIIARIPYQSWEVFSYCAMTIFFSDEERALRFANVSDFARVAQDNETMHVVVISQLMRKHGNMKLLRTTLIPMVGAFVYFWASFILYFFSKRASLELNYLFETHAYKQYQQFLDDNEELLKSRSISCRFLQYYGRCCDNEYEFFELVRNDELLHRNSSIIKIHSET